MPSIGKINQKAEGKQAHGHGPGKSTSQNTEQSGEGWREMGVGVGVERGTKGRHLMPGFLVLLITKTQEGKK